MNVFCVCLWEPDSNNPAHGQIHASEASTSLVHQPESPDTNILKSTWEALKNLYKPKSKPCPTYHPTIVTIAPTGYQSIKDYEQALLDTIERLFTTEYTLYHHLISPAAFKDACQSEYSLFEQISCWALLLQAESSHDGQGTATITRHLRAFLPHPDDPFYEQKEVVRYALKFLNLHFSLGDGVPVDLEDNVAPRSGFLVDLEAQYSRENGLDWIDWD